MIAVRGLVAGYVRPVCRPVSFEVGGGEAVGLAGANGAGKSTVLAAITGEAAITCGEVQRQPGLEIAVLTQHDASVGECPLSGRDLLLAFDAGAIPPPEGLAPLLNRRIDAISGGEWQLLRVWFCLGGRASLVLLDEPDNHLDPRAKDMLVTLLRAARGRRDLVVVSHDRGFLARICDRVIEVLPANGAGATG